MNIKLHSWVMVFFMLSASSLSYGQEMTEKRKDAKKIISDYIDFIPFDKGIELDTSKFYNLFAPSALMVFDVPFKNTSIENEDIKRISRDDRRSDSTIRLFQKMVSKMTYLEKRREYCEDPCHINDSVIKSSKEPSIIGDSIIIFEIEKRFAKNKWVLADTTRYLIEIRWAGDTGPAKIFEIRRNNDLPQFDLAFKFVQPLTNSDDSVTAVKNLPCDIDLRFEESINDTIINRTTDNEGSLLLGKAANKRTKIVLGTMQNNLGLRYRVADAEWQSKEGKLAKYQPPDGYVIKLTPYKWNGFAYNFDLYGGIIIQSLIDQTNFKEGSTFKNDPGYKFGVDFNLIYYFNHGHWKKEQKKWLIGIGTGIGTEQIRSVLSSDGFTQNRYPFVDASGDDCEIEYSSTVLKEVNNYRGAVIPIFIDLRKWLSETYSISIEAGLNIKLSIFGSNYETTGKFSRHGYYPEFNDNPIVDDPVYNYYTNQEKSYSGNIEYNSMMAEAFMGFNWFISTSQKHPDRTLKLGFVMSMPFTESHAYNYSDTDDNPYKYKGYWINTENDEYHSLVYSRDKLYNYYFGVSIGINLIKFNAK